MLIESGTPQSNVDWKESTDFQYSLDLEEEDYNVPSPLGYWKEVNPRNREGLTSDRNTPATDNVGKA
jgi:hypothetical protein